MPSDQTSLNRGEYEPLWANCPPWHSEKQSEAQKTGARWWGGRSWHTWAHVVSAACPELFTERVGSGQSEIGDGKT